jgi:hypothetical protein
MKKTFTLIITACTLFFIGHAKAQTMPFGKVDIADLQLKQCDFEKDANAMVLFDKADVYFDSQFNIVTERHKRIKIFNDKGKDEANIRIEFYGGSRSENMSDIQVETINDNNGKPEITKLEKKLIYNEAIDKWRTALVFAFPNVKAGSIIEYKYRLTNVSSYALPDWYFQSKLPSRYSILSTETPDALFYKTQTRVNQPFVVNTSGSEGASTDKHVRALANIPSLNNEPYMRSRIDNLQCIWFQLTTIRPSGGFVRSFNDTWEKVGITLAEDEDFGGQLKRKLKDELLIVNKAKLLKTDDEKIAYIFNQVKGRMKWNDIDHWYTNDGTSEAWDKQSGNSTEINLGLCHLLKQVGVKAYPMIVSTRDNGRINGAYPSLGQFNRAVAYIPVDSTKHYILDATDKYNLYNETPDELLNSYGLYLDKDEKKYPLLFIEKPTPVRQILFINANVLADGKLDGTAEINSFSYHKIHSVEKYKRDGEEKYKKYLKDDDNNLDIASVKFENMDVDTLPLTQKIGFKLTLAGSDENYIYINPNTFSPMKSNPFINENRATDIDFGYRNNYIMTGTYKIPAGFKTDAIPKNISMTNPDKSIIFRRVAVEEEGAIKINYTINFKKTIYFKEDYPVLREFYKKMYDMMNEQIVLKKG